MISRLSIAVAIAGVAACGGAAVATDPSDSSGAVAPPVASVTSNASAPTAHAQPPQDDRVRAACQGLLDLPHFQPYLHLDRPALRDILIVRGSPCDDRPLVKTGARIAFIDGAAAPRRALRITAFTQRTNRFFVDFTFASEGVVGSAQFEVEGETARVLDHSVAER